jgi:hypothetical protein
MMMMMMMMMMIATIVTVTTAITKMVTKMTIIIIIIIIIIIMIIITSNYVASEIASNFYSIIFGSKLGCDTEHRFRGISLSLEENSGVILQIRPIRLYFTFLLSHD